MRRTHLAQVGHQVVMGQHHALGQPGRAARERQEREVARADADRRGIGVESRPELVERNRVRARLLCGPDQVALGDAHRLHGTAQLVLVQVVRRDQPARAGVTQLVSELIGGRGRIERRDDRADRRRGVPGEHELDAVRRAQGEHVVLTNVTIEQAVRDGAHGGGHLGVGQLASAAGIDERPVGAVPLGALQHELGQSEVGNRNGG